MCNSFDPNFFNPDLLPSMIHAAESRIYILVVSLEPVAKRRPQHAPSGARRAALHDKVFSIEKIRGVSPVKRKRLESRERGENTGSPLPSIPHHVVNPKSALPRRKSVHRRGIPTAEIKVAESCIGLKVAPGIFPFDPVPRAVGCAVPLCFGGKRLPRPPRIRHRLGMTHIDRPIQRQRNLLEHAAVEPSVTPLSPEHGMRDRMRALPVPVIVVPVSARFIPARCHESKILPVRHYVL